MTIPCCDWLNFRRGLLAYWVNAKPRPSELLIDWKLAAKDHRRGNTGMESAFMQLRKLREEAS